MATALTNLATMTAVDRTTLASITAAVASANTKMASLKRKLKIQSNPAEKIFKHGNYFWTYCFCSGKDHSSESWK